MADWGIKVTNTGSDVNTETDVKDFVIHSGYNILKVHPDYSDYGSVTLNDGNSHYETITISHNFGYNPVFLLFFQREDDSVWKMPCWDNNTLFVGKKYTDTNTITIYIYHTKADAGSSYHAEEDVEYRYFTCVDPRDELWY